MTINRNTGIWAIYGGALLGGGGGGDIEEGLKILDIALSFNEEIPLISLKDVALDTNIVTASLVGSPASPERYIDPSHYRYVFSNFRSLYPYEIAGIITNELGAQSSTNGWILSAMSGIPLIDAPCNGRAHPTGVMGSLGLAKEEKYQSYQAAVGGKGEREINVTTCGNLENTSKLIRSASELAGGFVTVLRNPVKASYVADHAAVGALSLSIDIGRRLYEERGRGDKVEYVLKKIIDAEIICSNGSVKKYSLTTEGGFDIGAIMVENEEECYSITFWNEYMTVDNNGKRLATFPDLINLLDAETGIPLTSAVIEEGQKVIIVKINRKKLILGSSMANRSLFEEAENIIKKELVKYVF